VIVLLLSGGVTLGLLMVIPVRSKVAVKEEAK
jgi:hypothetical protein